MNKGTQRKELGYTMSPCRLGLFTFSSQGKTGDGIVKSLQRVRDGCMILSYESTLYSILFYLWISGALQETAKALCILFRLL
jgi:hypothetical protein